MSLVRGRDSFVKLLCVCQCQLGVPRTTIIRTSKRRLLARQHASFQTPALAIRASLTTSAQALKSKGKGKSKGKTAANIDTAEMGDTSLPSESFHMDEHEKAMRNAIDRLRVALKSTVDRVGRVNPSILSSVKVELPIDIDGRVEKRQQPLLDLALVKVKDAVTLLVSAFDPDNLKEIERAIGIANLGLTPNRIDKQTLSISVPKPTVESRQVLSRQAQTLCEHARTSIRTSRNLGMKEIRSDQDRKVIGEDESRKQGKKLDELSRRHTKEVDDIFDAASKIILDK
ncbi:uncharacterized protein L969DRAFT_89777 [Mixia osmundae IAM 14324]|uniref:Ribosome recycling factor domain-containing protein n=1 Tax=Mixia osmundae (strain CBS 9802 / IAM 14324 / JCM 22182 / KY 12970) TaxID=764103 RepID=G7E537_MIXOS|nr:uncharacterized protein L969DRAFT_89777 [Mixia osmundae IAM 14324]KEI37809.1 hypothetical protein L969DRAFT_89777 [Mixia osmundae IAM 14324]GAA97947.1 hypothetical protein E5Q_04627 [Mixia osmundae IAM 14324]